MKIIVNGVERDFDGHPFKRLIDVLREDFGLTGTKEGCGEGECGACTVVVDGRTVNSCLIPAAQVEGAQVKTVEGLGSAEKLHPVQKAFLKHGGAQCGICTPGMLVSASEWLRKPGKKDERTCREALSGNLCRCTGYQPIVDSVLSVGPSQVRGRSDNKGRKRARR